MVVAPLVPTLLSRGSKMLLGSFLAAPGGELRDSRDGGRPPQQASGSHASAGLSAAYPAQTDTRTCEDVHAASSTCIAEVEACVASQLADCTMMMPVKQCTAKFPSLKGRSLTKYCKHVLRVDCLPTVGSAVLAYCTW